VLRRFGHVSTQLELNFEPIEGCLSRSEHAVLRLVAQGYITDEISERLKMTAHVIATHVRSAYIKLQLNQCPALRPAS
jgi:DNA-binding CsgD family transcriptional regulator